MKFPGGFSVMTSVRSRLGLGLVCAASAQVTASAAAPPPVPVYRPSPAPRIATVPAPTDLHDQVIGLARSFDGKAGIAIVSLRDGWEIDWNASSFFLQQSSLCSYAALIFK